MKEKFTGPASGKPESDSGVFPVSKLYVEPLDWGDFGDINGKKKYGVALRPEQKSQNPFLERKDYADQLVKELENEVSPSEQVDQLGKKKRLLEHQVAQKEQSHVRFIADTNKQVDSLQKVINLLTKNESSKSKALINEAMSAIVELQQQQAEGQKNLDSSLAILSEDIEVIDTEIRALGGDPATFVKREPEKTKNEMTAEQRVIKDLLMEVKTFESHYEEYILPLIKIIETTLGSSIYLRLYSENWHKLGFDPSGNLNQTKLRKLVEAFGNRSRYYEACISTGYDEVAISRSRDDKSPSSNVSLSSIGYKGYLDQTRLNVEGTKLTNVKDRKVIAAFLIEDYKLMKKKIDYYRDTFEARAKILDGKTKNTPT